MASTTLTPSQRSLRARIAAHALHAQGGTYTAAATAAFLGRFERMALEAAAERGEDLTPDELARRAHHARVAYMSTLALKASLARSRQRSGCKEPPAVGDVTGQGQGGRRAAGDPRTA